MVWLSYACTPMQHWVFWITSQRNWGMHFVGSPKRPAQRLPHMSLNAKQQRVPEMHSRQSVFVCYFHICMGLNCFSIPCRRNSASKSATPQPKALNLNTYKMHALGDYVSTIRESGTTDSYSTETVCGLALSPDLPLCLAHRESLNIVRPRPDMAVQAERTTSNK